MGVVGAQEVFLVLQEVAEHVGGSGGLLGVSCFQECVGEAAPGGKGVGVVGAHGSDIVLQETAKHLDGLFRTSYIQERAGETAPGGQGLGVIRAKDALAIGEVVFEQSDCPCEYARRVVGRGECVCALHAFGFQCDRAESFLRFVEEPGC